MTESVSTHVEEGERRSLAETLARKYGMEATPFRNAVISCCFADKKLATVENLTALFVIANEYNLNPFTRQIYVFKGAGGGIVPIVSADGWYHIITTHPQADGLGISYDYDESGNPISCTCTLARKDWSAPVVITEFLAECKKNSPAWNNMPHRMLRHRAIIQAARVAFGLGGIYDPEEGADVAGVRQADVTVVESPVIDMDAVVLPGTPVVDRPGDFAPTEGTVVEAEEDPVERAVPEALFPDEAEDE